MKKLLKKLFIGLALSLLLVPLLKNNVYADSVKTINGLKNGDIITKDTICSDGTALGTTGVQSIIAFGITNKAETLDSIGHVNNSPYSGGCSCPNFTITASLSNSGRTLGTATATATTSCRTWYDGSLTADGKGIYSWRHYYTIAPGNTVNLSESGKTSYIVSISKTNSITLPNISYNIRLLLSDAPMIISPSGNLMSVEYIHHLPTYSGCIDEL